jgi:hypothetical protein
MQAIRAGQFGGKAMRRAAGEGGGEEADTSVMMVRGFPLSSYRSLEPTLAAVNP